MPQESSVKDLIRQPDGRLSTSDAFMYFLTGVMMAIWLGILVGITWFGIEWPDYDEAMDWGKDLVFISVLPYISNRFSKRKEGT